MANTPTREHREAAAIARAGGATELLIYERRFIEGEPQRGLGVPGSRVAELERIAQVICDAEQRGFERGRETERPRGDDGRGYEVTSEHRGIAIGILDGTDFTDGPDDGTEVIARALARAEAYGRETERTEVVNYLRQPEHDAADLAHNIESGRHLAKEE